MSVSLVPRPKTYFSPGDRVVLRVAAEPTVTFEVAEVIERAPGVWALMLGTIPPKGLPQIVGFFDPDDVKLVP